MPRAPLVHIALREALDRLSISYSALARALGVTPSAVSRWATGAAKPDPHLRIALARMIPEVPETAWISAREWIEVDRAVARWTKREAA
jgi:transcriptional regulator with XRE-family HTH domain